MLPQSEVVVPAEIMEVEFSAEAAPSFEDAVVTIKKVQRGKASGEDGIFSELLKVDPEAFARLLFPLILKASLTGRQHCRESPKLCLHYRGVYLCDIIDKCYHATLRRKLRPYMEEYDPKSQTGSIGGRGTPMAVLTINSMLQYAKMKGLSATCIFLDAKSAFDRVVRQ